MTRQQVARYAFASLGLGTAVALYVLMRERPPAPPMAAGPANDPQASVQARDTTQSRSRDGVAQYSFFAESSKVYPDGRSVSEGVKITLEDGTVMSADRLETKAAATPGGGLPSESHAKGHVKFQTPDGVSLAADEATMTDASGQVTIVGPVSFTRGRLSGSGNGGLFERDTGAFRILAEARVTSAATEVGRAIDATASTLTFNRATQALLLEGQTRIQNGGDVMTADRATLYLTEKQDRFRLIELRGQAKVTPAPGGDGGTPEMQAVDIDLAFHDAVEALQRVVLTKDAQMVTGQGAARRSIAAGTMTADTAADGRTMTGLDARERVRVRTPARDGVPERTITAATLLASGDEKRGLTAAQFSGGATLVETIASARGRGAATDRTATAQTLTLKLGGSLDAVEEAQFRENFTFKDADATGEADTGVYRATKGQLVLSSVRGGKRLPRVVNGDVRVDAMEFIELDLNTKDLHARGDVKTITTGSDGARRGGVPNQGGLFNDREPMLGFATEFWFDGGTKRARYRGLPGAVATLRQGEAQVSGVLVELVDETRDLSAEGEVTTVMVMDSGQGRGVNAGRHRVTADSFAYAEGKRTATYAGTSSPVSMTSDDGRITSRSLTLALVDGRRALDRLDARGAVSFKLTSGHEGISETLVYEAARTRYALSGRPLVLRTKGKEAGTCDVSTAARAYFTVGGTAPEFPPSENPGGVHTRKDAACTGPLTP